AIFCYDLINEPVAPGKTPRAPGAWCSGTLFGGYDFLQYLALDAKGRTGEEIGTQWVGAMTAAIRKHDPRTMITMGMLPFAGQWGKSNLSTKLDYISVHIYPKTGKVDESLKTLKGFAVGKPVVIEETFPLSCGVEDLEKFLRASQEYATGWIGHYDGQG